MLRVERNSEGLVDAVLLNVGSAEQPSWASLPYNSAARVFLPGTEAETALLVRAQQLPEWVDLDLEPHAPTPAAPPTANYRGFEGALRSTPLFAKAVGTAAKNEFAVLLYTLGNEAAPPMARLGDFVFALQSVIAGISGGLSAEERSALEAILSANHLPSLEAQVAFLQARR